ncbi:MAG: peptidoglycan recognition family protein [Pseudomonadota bacterium]
MLRVKPRGIIVRYTINLPMLRLVRYQHNGDDRRGGHFGYHFYVDRLGRVVQGAPLRRRTNHIRGLNSRHRKPGPHAKLDSTSTIGVGMVGACIRVGRGFNIRCKGERLTAKQQAAGVALIQALIERYDLTCMDVYGHGELQTNRAPFEGITLAKFIRHQCQAKPSVLEHNPVASP